MNPRYASPRAPHRARARLLAAAWALALVALLAACRPVPPLGGTDLGGVPSPDFTLTDQDGQIVQLAALRGRPVVLTFLFTECPDICPLTAQKLRKTADLLGDDAARVALLAVSTDPEHDDAAAVQRFSAAHDLTGRWHFLIGSRAELQPVWAAYYIHAAEPPRDADPAERATYALQRGAHTDGVYVLDREGRQRHFLRSDFDPAALAAALRGLLG